MLGQKPRFIKPGDTSLYPTRNKDGVIETLVNPNIDSALTVDTDAKSNFVYNRYHHLPLETQRQRLPVFQYRNHILYLLEKYQTLILIGETGCGKSTQVPQYLFETGYKVCVTQPRVTGAVSLAGRVAEERAEALGAAVGYAAAMTSVRTSETGIVFMTEGVLLREMFASPLLMQYSCIVLDEVHERSQMTDVLMGLLKKIAKEQINTALEQLRIYAEQNNEQNKYRKQFPSGFQAANLKVLPMYGTLRHYEQIKVFQIADRNVRKVILATNIAETSVTIPGIVYVIDSGYHKLPYFVPSIGVESLCVAPISKNNAIQRAGRAGRTSHGKCYRLYTEDQYEKLSDSTPPEMCRSDLSSMLLQLKALGIHNVLRFTFPTPPPAKCLLAGLETLYALKAIDRDGNLTDDIGVKMAELPLRPMCAKMLCNSDEYGCIDEVLSIAAMLQVDNVFVKTSGGKSNMSAKISRRNHFEVAEGDIVMYLNIFNEYMAVKSDRPEKARKEWCNKMYINYKVIEKACEIRESLEKLIKGKFKMENKTFEGLDLGTAKCQRIMKCVLSGLFPQAAYLSSDCTYRSVRGARLHISEDSCLYNLQQPKWVVFASVQSSGVNTYMRDLMVIKEEWLLEVAPHYYRQN